MMQSVLWMHVMSLMVNVAIVVAVICVASSMVNVAKIVTVMHELRPLVANS